MVVSEEDWGSWLKEGHFYSIEHERIRTYFSVIERDLARLDYYWEADVLPYSYSGPFTVNDLETTKETQLWQILFSLEPDIYLYTYLPTDVFRHGVARRTAQSTSLREVGHFTHKQSPYRHPSFQTEHFLIKPIQPYIAFGLYNPLTIALYTLLHQVKIEFLIAKCEMEIIGTEKDGQLSPADDRFTETLDKLYRRVIPHRPLTLRPVRAPARGA